MLFIVYNTFMKTNYLFHSYSWYFGSTPINNDKLTTFYYSTCMLYWWYLWKFIIKYDIEINEFMITCDCDREWLLLLPFDDWRKILPSTYSATEMHVMQRKRCWL